MQGLPVATKLAAVCIRPGGAACRMPGSTAGWTAGCTAGRFEERLAPLWQKQRGEGEGDRVADDLFREGILSMIGATEVQLAIEMKDAKGKLPRKQQSSLRRCAELRAQLAAVVLRGELE